VKIKVALFDGSGTPEEAPVGVCVSKPQGKKLLRTRLNRKTGHLMHSGNFIKWFDWEYHRGTLPMLWTYLTTRDLKRMGIPVDNLDELD